MISGVIMLEQRGWQEEADLIQRRLERAIAAQYVIHDFGRLREGTTKVKWSVFGRCVIEARRRAGRRVTTTASPPADRGAAA